LLQNRVGSGVSFLARIGLFAAVGALFSLPFAVHEMWSAPSAAFSGRAALVYLFAGLVPAFLPIRPMPISARSSARCRRRSASISGPIVSAVLSILFLGEAPTVIHLIGGALSLGGMWLSLQGQAGQVTRLNAHSAALSRNPSRHRRSRYAPRQFA
jgi:drug/metabolite transporter (DMT)-like permease